MVAGPMAAAAESLNYSPIAGMGRWMGYIAGGMMSVSALYSLRLHIPGLRRIGSSTTWFSFHVVFGLAGPMLALLHTDLQIFSPMERPYVTTLWWSIVLIVISGVAGRFLYTAIPKLEHVVKKQKKDLDEGIQAAADQWSSMTKSANVLQQFMKAQEKSMERGSSAEGKSAFGFMRFILNSELQRFTAGLSLRFRILGSMKNRKLRRATIAAMSRRVALERRMEFYEMARRLLSWWRSLHIALSIIMFLLLFYHVASSVYVVGW